AGPAAVLPLDGPVVRGFDPPDRPWLAGHRGVDIRGPVGARVGAAMAGRVVFAGTIAGRGVVVVSHGALRTTYLPVAATVRVGEVVATGQRLGTLRDGHSCPGGTCLHWGLKRGDTYLNPLDLLVLEPLRLLPGSPVAALGARAGPAGVQGPSGPRVRLLVGPPQPVAGDVGVQLRRGQ
ncbi:murein hydrolase activator EnvC family protein, partial [Propionicimonas sp.]|uniref:murein hydrolase activator EnvC family protein n=1 Tax=Propionicimonas sp. TaxID=1955623 RepID=UPI0039E71FC1